MDETPFLYSKKEIEVRFSELDPLGIVWHGNYIKYFEDGREAFGLKYGISYPDFQKAKLLAPIISVKSNFIKYVKYGERLIVETRYEKCEAAKIILNYSIFNKERNEIVAKGQTQQVFTDLEGNLLICSPEFYDKWKAKWKV